MNENFLLRRWAQNAVYRIAFPGDREKVYAELMAHMEDHRDALMEQGMSEREACEAVEKAMGDPFEVAKDLEAIHRPFWGYFLQFTRKMLIVTLIITLAAAIRFAVTTRFSPPRIHDWNMYSAASYGGDTGRTLLHMSRPEVSFETDGYTFTVTDAAKFRIEEHSACYFLVKEFNPRPWADHVEIGQWFWAEDSLGNYYYSYYEIAQDEEPRKNCMYANVSQTGFLTYTYEFWINDFPDADWVKICYSRDGRYETMVIDLTGGEAR